MSKLLLIRHGQASFGHSNYDQLSELGKQQATWLGEHLRSIELQPDRIISGTLQRHQQTAHYLCAGMGIKHQPELIPEWNEFDFHRIGKAYLQKHPEDLPRDNSPKAFFSVLRKALKSWACGELDASPDENFTEFEERIARALKESTASSSGQTVIVVSSGGAISAAIKQILRLDVDALIDLNLQTRNTGLSEIYYKEDRRYLSAFNGVPHLEAADKRAYITSA